MNRSWIGVVVLVLCSSSVPAQNAGATSDDATIKQPIIAQVDAFMHAWQKRDATALAATMAPEFLYVSSQGVAPKDDVVAALTHVCTLTTYSLSDIRLVRISPDSAAVVYKIHQNASCAGHADSPVVLNTDTLVRRDGQWLFLLTTSTPAQ